jgi:CheY-like chemotaxis protein
VVIMSAPKVLIVDDDPESRELIREVLQANGYVVEAVDGGPAALRVVRGDGDYRIVIADLRMPEESGLELLRNLRQQKFKHDMILMSSFISGPERIVAEELGAHALLEKPFRFSELIQIVAELANKNAIRIRS